MKMMLSDFKKRFFDEYINNIVLLKEDKSRIKW